MREKGLGKILLRLSCGLYLVVEARRKLTIHITQSLGCQTYRAGWRSR